MKKIQKDNISKAVDAIEAIKNTIKIKPAGKAETK